MTPTFTVVMGVLGKPTLKDSLDSIKRQGLIPGDQVLIGIDTMDQGERPDVVDLIRSYGPGFEVLSYDAGYHCWGTEQINRCLNTFPITGTHIFTIGDDDIFVDGAYNLLRSICSQDMTRPVLYRFMAPWRELLWDIPRLQRCKISGCCIAAPVADTPNHPTRNSNGDPYPDHDYDWILEIMQHSGREPLWVDEVLVLAKPPAIDQGVEVQFPARFLLGGEMNYGPIAHQPLSRCLHCDWWNFRELVPITLTYCPKCHAVLPIGQMFKTKVQNV